MAAATSAALPDIAAIAARFALVVVNISVTGTGCWPSAVTSAEQAAQLVARSDKAAALLVQRGGTKLYVALRLE